MMRKTSSLLTGQTGYPSQTAYDRAIQQVSRAWSLRWRNPLLSRTVAKRAYESASKAIDSSHRTPMGQAARVLGWHERWTGNFPAANHYLLEAEELLQHDDFKSQRIEAMAGRAVVLYSQGKQDAASELTRLALHLLGPSGSASTRVDLFLVQATILSYSSAFDDALALVQDAIDLAYESGSQSELAQAFHIRARIFMRMDRPADALKPARKAVRIAKASRSAVVLPYALEVVAAVQLERGRFNRSHWLAKTAAELGDALNDQRVTCQSLVVLGKALNGLGDSESALNTHRRGLQIATEISYPLWQRWFQLEIANIMEAREDFRAALPAYKSYIKIDQDLFRKETETRMAEMRTKFDLQRAQELAEAEHARAEELGKAREVAELAARTDHLTGIANRAGLEGYIAATRGSGGDQSFAYVVIDLDRFKPINDTFGHSVGDAVLSVVAARLQKVLRRGDFVARTGGDEFALIIRGISSQEDATQLGQRLLSAFEHPETLGENTIEIPVSIGIATSNVIGKDLDSLMRSADQAMYAAKATPEPAFRIYDADQTNHIINLNFMGSIRSAIANGEIQPWFQPKINLRTGALVGFETLARWVKPDGTVVLPGVFIPQIEQHKLGGEFTFAMLRMTLEQMATWRRHGIDVPNVAINVIEEILASPSGHSVVESIFVEFPEFRSLITFEITEDVFFDRGVDQIRESIRCLSAGGTRFAMDDFGTGFGSFTHLQQLKMNELKIDTTFVHGIGNDKSAEVIIEGFIYIAKGLNLTVIAEGIETKEQVAFLLARGCKFGQGFLFSSAIPPNAVLDYLTANQSEKSFVV